MDSSLPYIATKQVLAATLDCIYEERGLTFHGSKQAVEKFKERLTTYYVLHYRIGEELEWPASMCT